MVSLYQVEEQLKRVGCNFKLWGRSEVRELANVLMPEEQIAQAANGTYEGGFALLCVTNYRVLLVDRKPMLLTLEDIRYDMMAEVDYQNRLLGATIRVCTPTRNLVFSSWSNLRLRKCVNYIQQRVMELRQHGLTAQQMQTQVNGIPPFQADNPAGGTTNGYQNARNGWGRPQAGQNVQNGGAPGYTPMNPYTRTPMLMKRRRFPSLY
jgi:hypothetical protein